MIPQRSLDNKELKTVVDFCTAKDGGLVAVVLTLDSGSVTK